LIWRSSATSFFRPSSPHPWFGIDNYEAKETNRWWCNDVLGRHSAKCVPEKEWPPLNHSFSTPRALNQEVATCHLLLNQNQDTQLVWDPC